jgi:hypothetical protein
MLKIFDDAISHPERTVDKEGTPSRTSNHAIPSPFQTSPTHVLSKIYQSRPMQKTITAYQDRSSESKLSESLTQIFCAVSAQFSA